MKLCIKCAEELEDEDKFCFKCGAKLIESDKPSEEIVVYENLVNTLPAIEDEKTVTNTVLGTVEKSKGERNMYFSDNKELVKLVCLLNAVQTGEVSVEKLNAAFAEDEHLSAAERDKIIVAATDLVKSIKDEMIDGDDMCDAIVSTWDTPMPQSNLKGSLGLYDAELGAIIYCMINGIYDNNPKRFIRQIARKWHIGKTLYGQTEAVALKLAEIAKKRIEIEDSDIPYREAKAILSRLAITEKEAFDEYEALKATSSMSGAKGYGIRLI
jgi:hypothetical protein